jgi:hypothetical protein
VWRIWTHYPQNINLKHYWYINMPCLHHHENHRANGNGGGEVVVVIIRGGGGERHDGTYSPTSKRPMACVRISRLHPIFLLITAVLRWRWVWSNGGMTDSKTEVLGQIPGPTATLSTTNLTWTGPDSNLGLCSDRLVTNCLSHGITQEAQFHLRNI